MEPEKPQGQKKSVWSQNQKKPEGQRAPSRALENYRAEGAHAYGAGNPTGPKERTLTKLESTGSIDNLFEVNLRYVKSFPST